MRKPILRVVFAVLLTLIVILGLYTVVLGASPHVGVKGGQVHVDAGLMPDLHHQLSSAPKLQSVAPQFDSQGGHHGCHEDSYTDPGD